MKKIALFVTALAVSLSLGGRVLADANTSTLADQAGITPDNKILYPIDKAIDSLKISLASGDDKKVEAMTEVAEERLGESEVMTDKGKADLANEAMKEYNDEITEAQDKVENAIDKTTNDSSESTTGSAIDTNDNTTKLDELKKLEASLADKQMYSIEVLQNIENKVSGNAKETIAQVIEMQTRKKEAISAVIKERQTLIENKKSVKEAEKALEQAKKAGDEQAIKTAEDTLKQAQQTLTTEKEKFIQVLEAKKQAMKGGVGQLKKQAHKDKNDQSDDTTAAGNTNTSTSTTPAQSSETTNTTNTDTNTSNTSSATTPAEITANTNTTVTNDTTADVKSKEKTNRGREIKASKEKQSNSSNRNKGNH